jgi:hypothetical protein
VVEGAPLLRVYGSKAHRGFESLSLRQFPAFPKFRDRRRCKFRIRFYDPTVLKRRYLYVLLFAVPALFAALIATAMMVAASAGLLWLFVLGDDPWPPVANTLLGGVAVLCGAATWLALLSVAYAIGKLQERRAGLNTGHVALAIGATVVLGAVIAARLTGLSLSGTRSDSLAWLDLCLAEGFSASSMPSRDSGDRTCICLDSQGREVRRVPLLEVD